MAGRPTYTLTECKTALNRVAGMDFRWSLNPYRGCVHGCHYCFARRYHAHLKLDPGDDFTGIIFVKANCPDVLAEELSRPSWRRDTVAVGTATDPYQPIEGKYRLTRRCLEAFAMWRTPIALLLGRPGHRCVAGAHGEDRLTVCRVTTVDGETARRLEPGTPPPEKRLLAMSRLVDAGVNAGVPGPAFRASRKASRGGLGRPPTGLVCGRARSTAGDVNRSRPSDEYRRARARRRQRLSRDTVRPGTAPRDC